MFEWQSPLKPNKHKIVTKLGSLEIKNLKNLETQNLEIKNDFENLDNTNNVLVVDFMSLIHHLSIKDFQNCLKLLVAGSNHVKGVCKSNELHIVHSSYITDSLKEFERERRSTCKPLHFDSLSLSTKFPSQPERFWACGENKEKLLRKSWIPFINVTK